MSTAQQSQKSFTAQLKKVYGFYTGGFVAFVIVLAILEQMGLPRQTIGYVFLVATILLYAGIGIISRTNDAAEYYVAGRRVPALFNGMAVGADWMSAASFIGMAGTLYLTGYSGLAFVMGWTGGYVLVALLLAPYLRKFGQFTIPDFLGARYGGHVPRFIGIVIAITVLVHLRGGADLRRGADHHAAERRAVRDRHLPGPGGHPGVLVPRRHEGGHVDAGGAVHHPDHRLHGPGGVAVDPADRLPDPAAGLRPAAAEGHPARTEADRRSEGERGPEDLRRSLRGRCREAQGRRRRRLPKARAALDKQVADAKAGGDAAAIKTAEDALGKYPKDEAAARAAWAKERGAGGARGADHRGTREAFGGKDEKAQDISRRNFLALIFCLMVGTAALPHILMRYYTTPSVKEARNSVTWSLFFIFLLYFTAPALAVLVKFVMYNDVVGTAFASLPGWVQSWQTVDPGLLSIARRQRRRHRAAGGDRDRRRHRRAGHAGDRRPAVRDVGAGGRGRSGRGAVDCGRPAADDRQRAVARSLLQDDRSERADAAPRAAVEDPAAGGRHPGGAWWRRRSLPTSCSWCRRRSRSRRRGSSRRW